MPTTVNVSIYATFDQRDPNHWAIYLENSSAGDVILQVSDDKGGVGYYVETPMYGKQPQRSARHEASIEVGTISSKYHDYAINEINSQPVDNKSQTWNCQAWVVEALDHLEEIGIFQWKSGVKSEVLGRRQHWQ
ncbi:hypothetical protein ACHAPO_006527 [Fusarium lateritium]